MNIKRHIPNILTIGNLVCGCLGILYADQYSSYLPIYFVWAAVIFDFFDGYVARVMNAQSDIGKQLDSLADMVSFGVLPTIVSFNWLNTLSPNSGLAYGALLIVVCAAIRLGKFNDDDRQKDSFIGLPTPANALFITGLIFLPPIFNNALYNTLVLFGVIVLFSSLMIVPMRMFTLKFKNFSWGENKIKFIFVAVCVVLLGFKQASAISLIVLLYVLFSLGKGRTMSNTL